VIAPVVAFQLVTVLPVTVLANIAGSLILIGTLMLIPELRHGSGKSPAAALTEEVVD